MGWLKHITKSPIFKGSEWKAPWDTPISIQNWKIPGMGSPVDWAKDSGILWALPGYAAKQNYQQQKENLAYQKGVQEETWLREDTATQRRAADLKAAGLSPVLAAGSAAPSGAVVSTSAPQREGTDALGAAALMMNMITQGINVGKTFAEIDNVNAQRMKTSADTLARLLTIDPEIQVMKATERGTRATAAMNEWNTGIAKKWNLPTNTSQVGSTIKDLSSLIEQAIRSNFGGSNVQKKKEKK